MPIALATGKSASASALNSHCDNGPASSPIRADIGERNWNVRFVPIATFGHSFDRLVGANETRHRQARQGPHNAIDATPA
jgi:hypothetical protein